MKNILNPKRVKITIISIFALMFAANVVHAHDLWVSQEGSTVYLGNSEACTAYEYFGAKKVANNSAQLAVEASKQYGWPSKPFMQPGCDALKKTAGAKSLVVAPNNGNPTRPTKDMTATTYTGNTVSIKTPCEGQEIKHLYSTKSWYKIVGRNETALCGKY